MKRLRARLRAIPGRAGAALRSGRSATLQTVAFIAFTAAAWIGLGMAAGLACVGLSCLVLEWLTREDDRS